MRTKYRLFKSIVVFCCAISIGSIWVSYCNKEPLTLWETIWVTCIALHFILCMLSEG